MEKAKGHGQSTCCICDKQGKWSLTWTSFLYRIKEDNYENLYCFEHAKEIEEGGKI